MRYTNHMEDFIKEMYTRINILVPEQLQISIIAKSLRVNVLYWNEGSRALFLRGNPYIFLNNRLTKQQQWQDFCHELAHVLMHCGHQNRLPPLFIEYQELKANSFMYHACIPTFMLNELAINDYFYSTVLRVSKLFQVEYEIALKRLTQYMQNKRFIQYSHGK
ncbi:ImmA/IrrE family metallo-endopeptidase [Lysinibacillus telephonicus]|uniref:ImmA/IrrE family metallo-endopeptidase n=1 Tax=Lysinibacillus telephonicus TaxID=1714840 RepID=UPI0031FD360D